MQEKNIFTEKWIIIGKKNSEEFIVKILSWNEEWKIVEVSWEKEGFWVWEKNFKKWEKITLYIEKENNLDENNLDNNFEIGLENNLTHYSIQWYWHLDSIIIWFFIFCWIVIWIWKKQWIMSLISLFWWVAMILFLLIPWIKYWYNPAVLTWFISFFATIFTILLITWNTKKSWIAIFWTIFWVIFAYIFAFLIAKTSWIDWLWSEDARIFAILNSWFNYSWIFFSWIIIWALWAVMDTTISIASWLNEVKTKSWHIWFKWLWKSWMTIWWDVMWWMINTLVFAYLWTSLIIVLSASMNWIWVVEFLNFNFIAEEILRTIAGTTWLVLSIPLTAFLGALILSRK